MYGTLFRMYFVLQAEEWARGEKWQRAVCVLEERNGWWITVGRKHAGIAVLQTVPGMLEPDKAIPVQAWTVPAGLYRQMKVVTLSALRTSRLYPQRNIPGTHFC